MYEERDYIQLAMDMEQFYLKKIFHNIPVIPINISIEIDALARFNIDRGDSYDYSNDALSSAFEYRLRYASLWDGHGGVYLSDEESYEDPLNHPALSLSLAPDIFMDLYELISTLLHELLHYYLWYIGWDYRDSDLMFDRECRRMGLPNNFDYDGDPIKIEEYVNMYIDYADRQIYL